MKGPPVAGFSDARDAVAGGRIDDLRELLDARPELARARDDGGTLLHHATGMATLRWPPEAPDMVSLLAERGAELDAGEWRDGTGETPLIHAVSVNNVPVVLRLLDLGADPERPGRHDQGIDTALGYALFYGQDPRLERFERDSPQVLLDHGCAVPVGLAAALGRADAVRQGLPELEEEDRVRALIFAAHRGEEAAVATCLEGGVPPGARSEFFHEELTPLHAAAGQGHGGVARLLLAAGADPAVRDGRFDATPLEWARHQGHAALVEILGSSR
jgi:ankyrin repeat protein